MKKRKTKLSFKKSTIVSLKNIVGGVHPMSASDSCPGEQCVTDAKTCAENGPCENTYMQLG